MATMMRWLVIYTLTLGAISGFYLPGLAPKTYCNKTVDGCSSGIAVYVNKLDSERSVLPFDYKRFPFCQSTNVSNVAPAENLGQVLFGERITSSPIMLTFGKNETCNKVCSKTMKIPKNGKEKDDSEGDAKQTKLLMRAIQFNYQHHWIIDNLPAIYCYQVSLPQNGVYTKCDRGFPIGCFVNEKNEPKDFCLTEDDFKQEPGFYLFNHLDFEIMYHPAADSEWISTLSDDARQRNPGRITNVKVTPRSLKDCNNAAQGHSHFRASDTEYTVDYTYSVKWIANVTIKWVSRWDYILDSMEDSNIQWFQILNALVIVLFMTGMIAMILMRTLHRDIARYNSDSVEEAQEEFGWKLVHGDVFRPPTKGMLLSVLLGNGVQLFFMTLVTLFFACVGFLSPANRGFLMTCAIICYVLMGTLAGYTASRIYKLFGGEKWKSNVILTAFLVPGIIFGLFFLLNIVLWAEGSSAAVPFGTLVAVLALWFGVSAPLTFIGAYIGFKKPPLENPVRTNQIPRQIPYQSCYTRPLPSIMLGAILPFGCIFLQLYFIFNSIWSHHVYYMFGLLFLVFIILMLTCSETAILLCYFHLCAEDYNWWWRSFLTTGFTALYLFFYSIHFFVRDMAISDPASTFLFFGYTTMMVFAFFLLTGCIGFFACFWFVRKIYSVVKVD